MKKAFIISAISLLAYACGSNPESKTSANAGPSAAAVDTISSNPDYKKGLELVANEDCTNCHRTDEKNIGPSYREVANKYEATDSSFNMLADKIIKGGQGVWGGTPMSPHPDLSRDNVKQILKYIFLLKNNK